MVINSIAVYKGDFITVINEYHTKDGLYIKYE